MQPAGPGRDVRFAARAGARSGHGKDRRAGCRPAGGFPAQWSGQRGRVAGGLLVVAGWSPPHRRGCLPRWQRPGRARTPHARRLCRPGPRRHGARRGAGSSDRVLVGWRDGTADGRDCTGGARLPGLVEPEAYSLLRPRMIRRSPRSAVCVTNGVSTSGRVAGTKHSRCSWTFTTALAPLPGSRLPGVTRSLTTSAREATCGTCSSTRPSQSAGWRR